MFFVSFLGTKQSHLAFQLFLPKLVSLLRSRIDMIALLTESLQTETCYFHFCFHQSLHVILI
jgi:hypothetical protein